MFGGPEMVMRTGMGGRSIHALIQVAPYWAGLMKKVGRAMLPPMGLVCV